MQLRWDPAAGADGRGLGIADNGSMRVRLAGAPPLGFAFDVLEYTTAGLQAKAIGGVTTALTAEEVAAIEAFLATYVRNDAVVTGPRP